ncbi:hypothetical protein LWI28_001016 [Acer negundo]|uniref:Short-chain dehydrogenase TIC 32, chloroplastic n=1 Tax=Acer negundo TaxID=4023 RepID=A0AAD5IBF9_ACENE|nr:hypothetical protein LWI28_001016 [Acer negundo]
MWFFGRQKCTSGFSSSSTAKEVTQGVDGSAFTAIVTGGSSGIGIETVRALALRGIHVTMAVRNVAADLSYMASVRKFVSDFIARDLPLNILINNAGIMAPPFTLSKDNIELQFATNHIGHFLLTNLLLDTMKKTAKESGREGRIVNVASDGHKFTYSEGIRFDKINDPSEYTGFSGYGQSKFANILHANELAKRLKEEGVNITVKSLHPGGIATNLARHNGVLNFLSNTIGKFFGKSLEQTLGSILHSLEVIQEHSTAGVGRDTDVEHRVPRQRDGIGDHEDEREVQLGGGRRYAHRAAPVQFRRPDVRQEPLDELTKRMKVEVSDFLGRLNPDAFQDWITALEDYFDWFSVPEERKVRFVKLKLKGPLELGEVV